GVCHRDLKPQNWLLASRQPWAPLRLVDFGLARAFDRGGRRRADRVGSFYFVAPEALRGVLRGAHDARCDLWSLGVIVYILLCGAPPFAGRTDRDILTKVARA
ncbi:hypothetical protein AURANDRAFT_8439, partial [Aureococcus anophagefferens]